MDVSDEENVPQALVSVIMPVYNAGRFIKDSVRSVMSQTYQNWELILVDDCSSDESVSLACDFSALDDRVTVVQLLENSGAAVARNLAIEEAKGRYIAFLDSDDLWLPEKLEIQISWMQKNGYAFCFSGYEKIDLEGKPLGVVGAPEVLDYRQLLKTNVVGCLTAVYDTHLIGKVYMPEIRKRQDWGLWLRILKLVQFGYGIPLQLGQYRVGPSSISADKKDAARYSWKLFRDVEGLKLPEATYFFLHYAIKGVLRSRYPELARKLGVMD